MYCLNRFISPVSNATQGSPIESASKIAIPKVSYFDKLKNDHKCVVLSPDIGSNKLSQAYAKKLKIGFALIDKRRSAHNQSEIAHLVGNLEDRHVLIIDDMIDTAGTLMEATDALLGAGASEVHACCSHAVLSGPAGERITNSPIKSVVTTNSIPLSSELESNPKIKVLSVASLLGEAILRIHEETSVSSLFDSTRE